TTTAIPVVMVTARLADENRIECFSAGADDFIPKPYIPDLIFQALADADAWRDQLDQRDFEGEIPIETHDEGESLRQLTRLRNLVLARTTIDFKPMSALIAALQEIWRDAITWGRTHQVGRVATLSYHLQANRLSLTLRDDSRWLGPEVFATRQH